MALLLLVLASVAFGGWIQACRSASLPSGSKLRAEVSKARSKGIPGSISSRIDGKISR